MKSLLLAAAIALPTPEPVSETWYVIVTNPDNMLQVVRWFDPPGAHSKCRAAMEFGLSIMGIFGNKGIVACVSESQLIEME